jgi:hypothetical protein
MFQAGLVDGLFLDLFPFSYDCFVSPKVDDSGRDVVHALVVALVVVIIYKGPNLVLEITGQIVVLEQDTVLHRLVPALDFSLGLWMEWRATDVLHVLLVQPFSQIARDVAVRCP